MFKKLVVNFILLLFSAVCLGQTSMIVPTAAGGAVDSLTRKFSKFVELKTGRSFVVENIGGAGGNIGLERFLKSKPNSLMITSSSWYLSINSKKFNLEDFKPITVLAEAPFVLAVNKTQNLTCEKLRSTNNQYFLGTASSSITEEVGNIIISKYPNIENVPYKAVKPATMDLLGNHIDAVIIGGVIDIVNPLIGLANSTDQRINGIPTFKECLGINHPMTMDFLLIANKNSNDKFVQDIETLVLDFLNDKEIQNYYQDNAIYENNVGTKKINSTIQSRLKTWSRIKK
jgi:tripartite-type tricarboxylate transporter receptor subunit TctC